MKARDSERSGSAAITSRASSVNSRMLLTPVRSMWARHLATPLMKGSQPSSPTSG